MRLLGDVRTLVDGLGLDAASILRPLGALRDHLHGAVDSFSGLRLTLGVESPRIVLSDFRSEAAAIESHTSLALALSQLVRGSSAGEIIFYAARPGAFVDLAADLHFALGLPPGTLAMDARPQPSPPFNAVVGLAERSQINQAVGVLVDRGRTPQAALQELNRLADQESRSLVDVARSVLNSIRAHDSIRMDDPVG